MTDSEIRSKGAAALVESIGSVEAERFITLLLREPFDDTKWRESLFEDVDLEQISSEAARLRELRDKRKGRGIGTEVASGFRPESGG